MATIARDDILDALRRLGELAVGRGEELDLLLLGGGVMVIVFGTRNSTHDLDVVILSPADRAQVRELAARVAQERNWPADWLNDRSKGISGRSHGWPGRLQLAGIVVRRPSIEQLLAMKLSASRNDVNIADEPVAQRAARHERGGMDGRSRVCSAGTGVEGGLCF